MEFGLQKKDKLLNSFAKFILGHILTIAIGLTVLNYDLMSIQTTHWIGLLFITAIGVIIYEYYDFAGENFIYKRILRWSFILFMFTLVIIDIVTQLAIPTSVEYYIYYVFIMPLGSIIFNLIKEIILKLYIDE